MHSQCLCIPPGSPAPTLCILPFLHFNLVGSSFFIHADLLLPLLGILLIVIDHSGAGNRWPLNINQLSWTTLLSRGVSCRILPSISKSKACSPEDQGCNVALSLVPSPQDSQLQHIKCWRADKHLVPSLGSGIRCIRKANSSCAWTKKKIESKNNNNKNDRSSFGNVGCNICFCLFFSVPKWLLWEYFLVLLHNILYCVKSLIGFLWRQSLWGLCNARKRRKKGKYILFFLSNRKKSTQINREMV